MPFPSLLAIALAVAAVAPARPPAAVAPAPAAVSPDTELGPLLVPGRASAPDTAGRASVALARREYLEGRRLEGLNAYASAITSYRLAVRHDPAIRDASYRMGMLFLKGNAVRQAAGAFAAEIERNPGHLPAARELGLAFSRLGDHRRAIRQLELLTTRLPDDGESWRALGFAYLQANRPRDAERALRRALALPPETAIEHRDLGHLFATTGRPDQARAEYRRAIALDPREAGAWVNLGNLDRAAGDTDAALEDYRKALAADSTMIPAARGLADLLVERRRFADAAAAYRRVTTLDPADENARMIAVRLYAALDRTDVALELARDGVRNDPRSGGARLMLGMALEAAGRARESMQELRRAEGLLPDSLSRARARGMIDALNARAAPGLRPEIDADSARIAAELRRRSGAAPADSAR